MKASKVEVHPAANSIIIDSVTFCCDFSKASIQAGHPMGPVFVLGDARAILRETDAELLVNAGVPRK